MTLKQFEEKHGHSGVSLKGGLTAICVGEDKSDEKRLDSLKISDYYVKLFRSKWAILEPRYKYSSFSGWEDYS